MLKQLIYRSRPCRYNAEQLAEILSTARHNNRRDQITGALVCREDLYVQLVEGPDIAVDALFKRIAGDERHSEVRLLRSGPMAERMFGGWAMLDDPGRSWHWAAVQAAADAVAGSAPGALHWAFERIAAEVTDPVVHGGICLASAGNR